MDTSNVVYSDFSGWVDPPADLLPPLSEDLTCEVAVIGGGLGGMSTALRLAERGHDVVLLEAEFCGHGSSSRNAGQLAGAPGGDLQLLNLFFRKKMPGMVRLAEHAAHFVEDLIETYDIDCDYEPIGNAFAAVSRGQMGRVRRVAKILGSAGGNVEVGTSDELGIPRGFLGGMREMEGGTMNPGKFTRGLRRIMLTSSARVFEQTKVTGVTRDAARAVISTPHGEVRANTVVLATNAFAGEWDITPRHLCVPIWVIEVETEPIDPERLAALGWTSRSGLVTQHNIMENYRLTPRNTIVFGVRRLERGTTFPLPAAARARTRTSSTNSPEPSRCASPAWPTSPSSERGAAGSRSPRPGCPSPARSTTTSTTRSRATATDSPKRRTWEPSSPTRSSTAGDTRTSTSAG